MRKFSNDDKQTKEFNRNYFTFGVHKVQIGMIEQGETDNGKEYIEFTVMDPEDGEITDTARIWFTTDQAANYSFNTCRQIYVHNAPEKAKDTARDTMEAVVDVEDLVRVMNEKLIGKECWFTKYYDPKRTYENQSGETKKSVNKNLYGYEPKVKPELMPKQDDVAEVTDKDLENVGKDVTGTKEAEGIPNKW